MSKHHAWFNQSVADATGECGDCFVWAEGKDGGPPNNWVLQLFVLCLIITNNSFNKKNRSASLGVPRGHLIQPGINITTIFMGQISLI